jgi:hypothetical protein
MVQNFQPAKLREIGSFDRLICKINFEVYNGNSGWITVTLGVLLGMEFYSYLLSEPLTLPSEAYGVGGALPAPSP